MYRSSAAVKRLLPALCRRRGIPPNHSESVSIINKLARFSTSSAGESFSTQNPSTHFDSASSSSASSSASSSDAFNHEEKASSRNQDGGSTRTSRSERVEYQDEQERVLRASLIHVIKFGWTESAMIAGAREAGVSPAIIGSFPRKEAALVEFFMDECLQRLIDMIDSGIDLNDLIHSERVAKLVKIRLEMQAPYISKWPQALSIQAQPANIPTSFKQRAMLIDEIWHASGDNSTDMDWYAKRTVLGGIYTAAELYMLTDASPDFRDTWNFVDKQVRDAFDLKKSIQEVKYLAEAVSAGMVGGSWRRFMSTVFPG